MRKLVIAPVMFALLTTGASSCSLAELLFGYGYDPEASFPMPTAEAAFSTGSATIKLGDQTLVLDELASGGSFTDDIGISAVWTNGEGWYLTYQGWPPSAYLGATHYITIDRVLEFQHWVATDESRCITTVGHADATGVVGNALCRGLRWSDYFDSPGMYPAAIEGQPAFDADITFEAK